MALFFALLICVREREQSVGCFKGGQGRLASWGVSVEEEGGVRGLSQGSRRASKTGLCFCEIR
jgi:hypothetical protein